MIQGKVVVTCATGDTGRATVNELLVRGHKVRALAHGHDDRSGCENSLLFQHLREVAIDHQNGIFAGTNDLVEKLGGRPPMTLEAFIEKHRAAFV